MTQQINKLFQGLSTDDMFCTTYTQHFQWQEFFCLRTPCMQQSVSIPTTLDAIQIIQGQLKTVLFSC